MKTILLRMSIVLFGILVIASCKKEDPAPAPAPNNNNNNTNNTTMSFSCKINGVSYSETKSAYFFSYGTMMIYLPFSSTTTISISSMADTGTYDLTSWVSAATLSMSGKAYSTSNTGSSGTMKITRYTGTEVDGTFNFVAKTSDGTQTVTVTEGKFNKIPSN